MTRVVADAVQRLTSDGIEPELTAVLDDLAHEAADHPGSFDPIEAAACATRLRQEAWTRCEGKRDRLGELLSSCLESIEIDDKLDGGASAGDPLADDTKGVASPDSGGCQSDGDSAIERLSRLRSVHQQFGKNPRARLAGGRASEQA